MMNHFQIDARGTILYTLNSVKEPCTWSLLLEKSGVGRGSMTTHLNNLIDEGLVQVEKAKINGRRTTVYSLLKEGGWEHERNRITSFLASIKNPAANNVVLKNGKMLYGSVLELENYEDFNKTVDALNKYVFGNKALVGMMEMIFKDMMGAKKAAITILYDSEAGFSIESG